MKAADLMVYEGWVGNDLEIIGEPKLIKEITEE